MYDRLDRDGLAILRSGLKLPLTERFNRVGVELLIQSVDHLDAVHASIGANDAVQNHFPFDMLLDEILRIFRVDLAQGSGAVSCALCEAHRANAFLQSE